MDSHHPNLRRNWALPDPLFSIILNVRCPSDWLPSRRAWPCQHATAHFIALTQASVVQGSEQLLRGVLEKKIVWKWSYQMLALDLKAQCHFYPLLPIDCAVIENEHKQTGVVMPRFLITAGLAPAARSMHTQQSLVSTHGNFWIHTQWD